MPLNETAEIFHARHEQGTAVYILYSLRPEDRIAEDTPAYWTKRILPSPSFGLTHKCVGTNIDSNDYAKR